jgi:ABC-2 type transport system ATP-binding protein
MSPPVIETRDLTKRYGSTLALEGLDLTVAEGEVLGFLGPNGAGKTTTVRLLTGMISPTSGSARVAGLDPVADVERLHETVGLLTESPGFYRKLTARYNLLFFARFYPNISAEAQVEKYLKLFDLWDRRDDRVGGFSKGMKQRLSLARALLHEPRLLFLDEPTAALDPEAAHEVRGLIKALKGEGRTIFLCTHNLDEAGQLCDRIALLHTRLVTADTPEGLRARLFKRLIVVELESVPEELPGRLRALDFVKNLSAEGPVLRVELDEFDKRRPDLAEAVIEAGGRILSFREDEHSLEEVYLKLIEEGGDGGNGRASA